MKNDGSILIISPPRAGSTLLAWSILQNKKVGAYCHEPCFGLKYVNLDSNNVDKQIRACFDSIKGLDKTIVIKEMAQWIVINDEYKKLIENSKKPILILIRNPLISTESKIRRSLMTCDLRDKKSLEILLRKKVNCELKNINQIPEDNKCSAMHQFLLDGYAASKSYQNWRDMIETCFDNRDYNDFSEILDCDEVFSMFDLGWESLQEIIQYMDTKEIHYLIIENLEFRIDPNKMMADISKRLELKFTSKMTNWGLNSDFSISKNQEKSYQTIWYETLKLSKRVLLPSEIPPQMFRFPKKIRKYLKEVCLPIYFKLYQKSMRCIDTDLLQKELIVPFNVLAISRLKDLNFISKKTPMDEITKQLDKLDLFVPNESFTELIFDKDEINSDGIKMKLIDVDPIFASSYDPHLKNNKEFMNKNGSYIEVFEAMK